MWEEIKSVVFDASAKSGLNPDFLGNLISESYGLIIGALLSVFVASLLDRQGDKARRQEHRVRAVTRWIQNHSRLLLRVRQQGGQGETDRRREERRDTVLDAVRNAEAVQEDYREALKKTSITEAFLNYINTLNDFEQKVYGSAIDNSNVQQSSLAAYEALVKLIQVTTPKEYKSSLIDRATQLEQMAELRFSANTVAESTSMSGDNQPPLG